VAADDDAKRGTIADRCRVREIVDRVGDKWSLFVISASVTVWMPSAG
jgi:DNA-binding HxlR family transcriptional regulator